MLGEPVSPCFSGDPVRPAWVDRLWEPSTSPHRPWQWGHHNLFTCLSTGGSGPAALGTPCSSRGVLSPGRDVGSGAYSLWDHCPVTLHVRPSHLYCKREETVPFAKVCAAVFPESPCRPREVPASTTPVLRSGRPRHREVLLKL